MTRATDLLAGLALMLAFAATIIFLLPASIWFEVRSTQVLNSYVGESPRMIVDRTTHIPFQGDWVVSVLRVVKDGFEPVCTATGTSDYDPANRFPPNLDLDWWTWPTQCDLPAGEYVVRTVWTLNVFSRFEKSVRAVSNLFVILPLEPKNGEQTQGSAYDSIVPALVASPPGKLALAEFFP